MRKEWINYESFASLSKDERRKAVLESGRLYEKRFVLSPDEKMAERLGRLHSLVGKFKSQHPEVVSLGLFGSLTKGYATPESDIDAILFIDTKQAEVEAGKTEQNHAVKNLSEYRAALQSEFQTFLEKQLDVHTEQTSHVFVHFVDESAIRRVLEDPKAEDQAVGGLFRLFLLSLSKGIRPYRQTVIETLEKQGVNGKRKWEMIIHKLAEFENPEIVSNGKLLTHMNAQREWLYPSLQKARRVFLQETRTDSQDVKKAA